MLDEVFPNPTVKQVVFQIRYTNLYYINDKIGKIQEKIITEFPESDLLLQKKISFSDDNNEELPKKFQNVDYIKRIWTFKSPKKFTLNIQKNSLDITSSHHKTYKNPGECDKFRDILSFVLSNFFEIIDVPEIKRIGLRYIDECPIEEKTNTSFENYYNSAFSTSRFDLANLEEMIFRTVVKRGKYNLSYIENFQKVGSEYKLILDFDGFITSVKPEDCLKETDELHNILSEEFKNTIKDPVYEYMRRKTE